MTTHVELLTGSPVRDGTPASPFDGLDPNGTGFDDAGPDGSGLPCWVPLRGACNVRDLGGRRTADGRVVRCGLVFRGDSPHRLDGDDVAVMQGLGITTVIDLRRHDEVARFGRGPVAAWAPVVVHLPLGPEPDADAATPTANAGRVADLGTLYRGIITDHGGELALLFAMLAKRRTLPVLVHCFAGKDRTGVVAALLLSLLGVPDDDVVADYAASAAVRARFWALAGDELGAMRPSGEPTSPDDARFDADADTMRCFLDWLRDRHGGAEGYLRRNGVLRADIQALRSRLVTDELGDDEDDSEVAEDDVPGDDVPGDDVPGEDEDDSQVAEDAEPDRSEDHIFGV
jgi:protein-tyrosine phosphatase